MARPRKHDGVVYRRPDSNVWWMRYRDRDGSRRLESTNTTDWDEAQQQLRERLGARDRNSLATVRKGKQLTFNEWADFFLMNYSKPPIRAPKTHEANENALKSLRPVFGSNKLLDIDANQIEFHLRGRLQQKRRVRRTSGVVELGNLQASSVHQEFRVLRRIFSVAVKKKMVPSNPCTSVEFPVAVKGLFRPHYMTWSEQSEIEQHAPTYLRNVIRIITETGLRVYKELICLNKEQVDIANKVVFVVDSKTPTGVSEVPLTDLAAEAFQEQLKVAGPGPWLFPSSRKSDQHQLSFKKVWRTTLRRAGVRYFRIYDLRSTYATRLSAGGVADEWVTQMLRQSDAKVFKKYSQMKLQIKREALKQLNRQAGDSKGQKSFDTEDDE
jgi:integrase